MVRGSQRKPNVRALFVWLLVLALGLCVILALVSPGREPVSWLWLLLPVMALLAELMPVQLSNRGVRITFTLPYVCGIAIAVGPTIAVAGDVLATLIGGYILVQRRRVGISGLWMGINAGVGAVSAAIAGLAFELVDRQLAGFAGRAATDAAVFMAVYATANFLLVTYLDWTTSGRQWFENIASVLRVNAVSLVLYLIIGMAVAELVAMGLYWYVPLTLVPVFALRTALQHHARMYEHYYETITALTLMLQRAHPYTHGHLERVARTAEEVARRLGLPASRARMVREAAVLHDIGKIAVNEQILDKPAKLTEEEMEHVRQHSRWGAEILEPVPQFKAMIPWILHHHERPDGTGYPSRLPDEQIPVESKIIAVIDAFDAMTGTEVDQKRAYRDPMTVPEALEELDRWSGRQFDTKVVTVFRAVIEEGRH